MERTPRREGWAFWKRRAGHHLRRRIEAGMRRLMAFGERIAPRDPDRRTAAVPIVPIRALMSRFDDRGTAEIARVA